MNSIKHEIKFKLIKSYVKMYINIGIIELYFN